MSPFQDLQSDCVRNTFVGRDEELATLRDIAAKVRTGDPWLVTIEGEPGVGKSSLIRRFLSQAEGFTVLRAIGDRSESDYGYGIIKQLLARVDRAVLREYPELREVVKARGAAFAAGEQLLLLLGELQSTAPVIIVIDDWQWSDPLSVQALGFVTRRLWVDGVLIVLGIRTRAEILNEEQQRVLSTASQHTRVQLGGLSLPDVAKLANGCGAQLSAAALHDLHKRTGGHALYVLTLLTEAASGHMTGARSLTGLIQGQLASMSEASCALLEALAVLDGRVSLAQVAALAGVENPVRELAAPLAAGLVDWTPSEPTSPVEFRHGIQRDAVYQSMVPERRRTMHSAAAELVSSRGAWMHRVAAVDNVSEELAGELEQVAMAEAEHGESDAAATHLLWAADISEHRAGRERRTLAAVALFLTGRNPARAAPLRAAVESCEASPMKSTIQGWFALSEGEFRKAEKHLTNALCKADMGTTSNHVGTLAGVGLSMTHALSGRGTQAIEAAQLVVEVERRNLQALQIGRACLAWGRAFLRGPSEGIRALTDTGWLPVDPADATPVDAFPLTFRAVFRFLDGQPAAAITDANNALRLSRNSSVPAEDEFAYFTLAGAQYQLGRWEEAAVNAERAITIALAEGKAWSYAQCYAVTSIICSSRGDFAGAEEALAHVSRVVREIGPSQYVVHSACAAAHLARAKGDSEGMLELLEPLLRHPDRDSGWPLVFRTWWWPLHVEALVAVGRIDEAETALAEETQDPPGSLHTELLVSWLTGLIAQGRHDQKTALRVWREGAELPDGLDDAPLYRAQLEQCYGRLLYSSGRHKEGTTWLRKARDRFAGIGAIPYLERCEQVLSALSGAVPQQRKRGVLELTAREREIAHRVGLGMTNPEIAAELYLSSKTVEYHLSNIFSRFGITNRRQLRDRVRRERPEAFN
ncbi:ATP/maltotriose-dependent transcriptional regulator MalT [Lentzea atacamensis]|uniref:ATP/maltotriose-dependent transcriptional regulator MalT n=1 Tax=Lentzea atacamensis TaxID=531938 RepID=A0A316HWC0_9PSEU|nr:LuxR family transcriptional regulator [Lentzea atacamensis]PWK84431.1 ATP/maltotriose-dependent transcriptional regulator MalT [Lentzea atacamensis]